ncbi:MAG: prepilin-type N-terminal cleavage/methylation domain-containing protein [Dehalococcoidia bacterium]|nr:prepilin-type N-terminal cleavage/methylation domain-containing protein [Dehalococcoidia bacterium]
MKLRTYMKLKLSEKGFTLIELVVGMSIAAFVIGATSMAIIAMERLSPRNSDWALALRQVQDAGYWISRDIQMSQGDITIGTGNPTFMTLTLPQISPPNKTIVYQFQNIGGNVNRLYRDDAGQQRFVADFIYYNPDADPSHSTRVISAQNPVTLQITATSGQTTVTREYKAMQRIPPAPAP